MYDPTAHIDSVAFEALGCFDPSNDGGGYYAAAERTPGGGGGAADPAAAQAACYHSANALGSSVFGVGSVGECLIVPGMISMTTETNGVAACGETPFSVRFGLSEQGCVDSCLKDRECTHAGFFVGGGDSSSSSSPSASHEVVEEQGTCVHWGQGECTLVPAWNACEGSGTSAMEVAYFRDAQCKCPSTPLAAIHIHSIVYFRRTG